MGKTLRVEFPGALGHELAARLEMPEGPPRAFALFAHCFSCSKDLKAVPRVTRRLAEYGIAVLRFDFTGLGESEGDFAETNFSSNLFDLLAAADYLRREHSAPQLIIGHSLGGAAVLAAANRVPESRAVATIAAPSSTQHLHDVLVELSPDLASGGEAEVHLGGQPFRVTRQFLDDLNEQRLDHAIENLGRPLLVLHSPTDNVVGIEHARHIFEHARHPKSFVSLDGADHLLVRNPRDAHFVAEVLAAWAGRYLGWGEPD